VYNKGVQVGSNSNKFCLLGTLHSAQVKGKLVLCERGQVVKEAEGFEMILTSQAVNGEELIGG
jgi:hypothetical protein